MADIASRENLSLTIYAETLSAFKRKTVFMDLVTKQTISKGKSSQFIVDARGVDADFDNFTEGTAGTVGANSLDAGVVRTHGLGVDSRTLASDILVGERTITVERPKIIRKNIDDFDAQIVPYNTRSIATGQMGGSMASYVDKRVIYELDRMYGNTDDATAFSGGVSTGYSTVVDGANVVTSGASIYYDGLATATLAGYTREQKGDATVDSIFKALEVLEGKDQDTSNLVFVTDNETYYDILMSQKAINRDFNTGNNGSIADGNVFRIGDITILKSNNYSANILSRLAGTSGAGSVFKGFVFNMSAIGMLELYGLKTKQWTDDDYDQYVMKAQLATGYGYLNSSACVAITTGDAIA